AAIGNGAAFSKGRDFGAWLGLVPKQISTGDRTILGKISRRGNRYLRSLFVQAAWVVLVRVGAGDRARQQACPHRLGGSQQGAQIRVHQDKQDVAPSCLSVAPWSERQSSRDGQPGRPLARGAPAHSQAGTKERASGTNK